jgi:hypothetical protein
MGRFSPVDYHLHTPIANFTALDPEQIKQIIAFLHHSLASDSPVLVWCGAGIGRTATILACYLVAYGQARAEAIATVRTIRPGSIETAAQEESFTCTPNTCEDHPVLAARRERNGADRVSPSSKPQPHPLSYFAS